MAQKGTNNFNDYINDYEQTNQDYQQMGPLWAEMVFGDDFEAMKALYGNNDQQGYNRNQSNDNHRDNQGGKRR